MKIAIIGEIHPDGWETLEKYNFKAGVYTIKN